MELEKWKTSKSKGSTMLYGKNIAGQKRGDLIVVKLKDPSAVGVRRLWECKCDCGNTHFVVESNLIYKKFTKSCGCRKRGRKPRDITNKKYGRLTAKEIVRMDKTNGAVWMCLCDCGNIHIVLLTNLIQGDTTSCGCRSTGDRSDIGELTKGYILRTLIRGTSLKRSEIPDDIIALKALLLTAKQEVKNAENGY